MNKTLLQSSCRALVAAGALLAAAQAVQAAPTRPDAAQVEVVGQMPLREACPTAFDGELADALAPAWEDVDKPATIAVAFTLQRHHVVDVAPATADWRTFHQIRRALHGLACDGGDDQPHVVRFVVRFVDNRGDPRGTAGADIVDAAPATN